MLVVVIVVGILLGWSIGNFFLDKWINKNNKDINNDGI